MMFDIEFPGFKPFEVDEIANIFVPFCIENGIPRVEVFN